MYMFSLYQGAFSGEPIKGCSRVVVSGIVTDSRVVVGSWVTEVSSTGLFSTAVGCDSGSIVRKYDKVTPKDKDDQKILEFSISFEFISNKSCRGQTKRNGESIYLRKRDFEINERVSMKRNDARLVLH